MHPEDAQRRLDKLREQRVAPRPDAVGASMRALGDRYAKKARQLKGSGGVWADHCPPQFKHSSAVLALTNGVLRIAVDSSATLYALDRWARGGGERAIITASQAPIRKLKFEPKPAMFQPPPTRKPNFHQPSRNDP
jgi:hypothetical protein